MRVLLMTVLLAWALGPTGVAAQAPTESKAAPLSADPALEARVLKITGPYRFVRHPIYLGQFLAQAGVWLVLANTHWVWIAFYVCFVALQLIRTRMEDKVLGDAFGASHRDWKLRTFWFA